MTPQEKQAVYEMFMQVCTAIAALEAKNEAELQKAILLLQKQAVSFQTGIPMDAMQEKA